MALVVFTGGARSGKSCAAQSLAHLRAAHGERIVVVVFGRENVDSEFATRVERHRAQRPVDWATIEASDPERWRESVPDDSLLLLDCLGTLLGACMEHSYRATSAGDLGNADADSLPAGFEAVVADMLDRNIEWLAARAGDTIVVTNEVGDGIVPGYATGRLFRDELGRANRRLVDRAEAAYLCVAGRLIGLDALPRAARWPED